MAVLQQQSMGQIEPCPVMLRIQRQGLAQKVFGRRIVFLKQLEPAQALEDFDFLRGCTRLLETGLEIGLGFGHVAQILPALSAQAQNFDSFRPFGLSRQGLVQQFDRFLVQLSFLGCAGLFEQISSTLSGLQRQRECKTE